ncbi:helix-turn-helix transcriptional regulator [Burkholderia sp. Ac-20344]|uniref:helix-turn-helix transcriptional regulator n=1 Tax=Burkholderia sp. Ac-20344 TaxID=2703890 RepID=UPI00197C816A|nr:helix-turn-helix transcriptional regulator [Burkholderia sp. Ac-20344]MBN3836722.1 helix-turn-helix transcriptional regulator [Burkholderia sp. Ac-20344]
MEFSDYKESHEFALQTVQFAKSALESSAAVFTWLDSSNIVPPYIEQGLGDRMLSDYYSFYIRDDPLNADTLSERGCQIATLREVADKQTFQSSASWRQFHKKYKITDEVDFLFWLGDAPIACLCVLRTDLEQVFPEKERFFYLYRYIQSNLALLAPSRQVARAIKLRKEFFLTSREMEVASLLCAGLSNKEIAEDLSVEVVTVKSHVIRILGKLGVKSRTQVTALLADF